MTILVLIGTIFFKLPNLHMIIKQKSPLLPRNLALANFGHLPILFLKREVNLDYFPQRGWGGRGGAGGRGGSMVQGQVHLKGRGGLTLSLFNFFKVYHFYI